jgi:hypothetical protein
MKIDFSRILTVVATLFASAMAAAAASITNDLVVHLAFDNTYQNSITNAVKATPVGQPSFAAGKIGSHALSFRTVAGRANYVTLGAPAELNFGATTDFSVTFWVKFSRWDASQPFVSNKNWTSTFTPGWIVSTSLGGGFTWNFRESNGIEAHYFGPSRTLSNGEWHHVAVTFDRGGNATAYLDGLLVNETPIGAGVPSVDTQPGLATNTIRVLARGSRFEFYANGALLGRLTDSNLPVGRMSTMRPATRTLGPVSSPAPCSDFHFR